MPRAAKLKLSDGDRKYLKAKDQVFPASGFLYVMAIGSVCKIGYSVEPLMRKQSVESEIGGNVTLEFKMYAENARGAERAAHLRLKDKRVLGEWFDVSVDEAIEAVVYGVANPDPLPPVCKPVACGIRPRPLDYFDSLPPTHINKQGRRHPDLILE